MTSERTDFVPMPTLREEANRTGATQSAPTLPTDTTAPVTSPTSPKPGSIDSNGRPKHSFSFKRPDRTNTAVTYRTPHPQWKPGSEPGYDVFKILEQNPALAKDFVSDEDTQITVVDYSPENLQQTEHDAASFKVFMERERDDWVKVRWISVSGWNRSTIELLGKKLHLHRLSIEDLVSKTRAKVDWFPDHTFVLLTMQKLIRTVNEEDDDISLSSNGTIKRSLFRKLRDYLLGRKARGPVYDVNDKYPFYDPETNEHIGNLDARLRSVRTLQSYFGGSNQDRITYMEANSMLSPRGYAVSVEQVSLFLTADNTVVAFFKNSADDIEKPLLERLNLPDTILRKSSDASLLLQAILDAITDLSYQIILAYQDATAELELDVLTDPSLKHTTLLYILTSELSLLRSTVQPISTLVRALKDHKASDGPSSIANLPGTTGVPLSRVAQVYLGDVEDHSLAIVALIDQMRHSSDAMIDLIFNRIGAFQNENMRQLTLVTILFLPLTFMTGYFGMNFHTFDAILGSADYFWEIAAPVTFGVIILLTWDSISRTIKKFGERRGLTIARNERKKRIDARKTKLH